MDHLEIADNVAEKAIQERDEARRQKDNMEGALDAALESFHKAKGRGDELYAAVQRVLNDPLSKRGEAQMVLLLAAQKYDGMKVD